jgi:STE24 endopeptidase
VIDGSKRSTKANAYFTGFGRNRRVVLYDTLIEKMTVNEIVAVLAHEIGHYRKRHIWINFGLGAIQSALVLYIFNIMAQSVELSVALGFSAATEPVFHLSLIAFGILFTPVELIIGLFTNVLSRRMEYQADAFAKRFGFANGLVSGLKKLSAENLSNLTPHPAYVFVNYSHPTLLQRIVRLLDK